MYTLWKTGHPINETVMQAFYVGSVRLSDTDTGFTMKDVSLYDKDKPLLPAISYGILRGTGDIFRDCMAKDVEWWEIDRGYFKPHHFDGYYRLSLNSTSAIYNTPTNVPEDRWRTLGINLSPMVKREGFALVCPPTAHVAKFYDINVDAWIAMVKEHVENVKVRPKSEITPIEVDLAKCREVITYNSNVGIEALIKGIPVTYVRQDWQDRHIYDGENREALFHYLAYCQFTLDEFKSGEAWKTVVALQKYGELQ